MCGKYSVNQITEKVNLNSQNIIKRQISNEKYHQYHHQSFNISNHVCETRTKNTYQL